MNKINKKINQNINKKSNKKVVFTDIDGTLLKGFITLDFVNYLFEENIFDSIEYQKQLELMKLFKKKQITLVDWFSEWAVIWGNGIRNREESELRSEAKKFFNNYNGFFSSSKKLISFFKKKGFRVIGVSVGVIETGELAKNYLGLDEVFASRVETKKGVYTGRVITGLHNELGKKELILEYSKKNRIDLINCVGVGDSIHDSFFIDLLGKKVALNPDSKLLSHAKKNNYLVSTHLNILEDIKKLNL